RSCRFLPFCMSPFLWMFPMEPRYCVSAVWYAGWLPVTTKNPPFGGNSASGGSTLCYETSKDVVFVVLVVRNKVAPFGREYQVVIIVIVVQFEDILLHGRGRNILHDMVGGLEVGCGGRSHSRLRTS